MEEKSSWFILCLSFEQQSSHEPDLSYNTVTQEVGCGRVLVCRCVVGTGGAGEPRALAFRAGMPNTEESRCSHIAALFGTSRARTFKNHLKELKSFLGGRPCRAYRTS